jgi:flavin-dependent dehydrogenase
LHTVTVHDFAQQKHTLRARWLIDATGRNRVLSKLLGLHQAVKEQKNVFWFRPVNFDPDIPGPHSRSQEEEPRLCSLFRHSSFLWKG